MAHSTAPTPAQPSAFTLLAGVRDLEPGVLKLLRQLNENNRRRLAADRRADAPAAAHVSGMADSSGLAGRVFRPSGAGREALANYLQLSQKLRGLTGNKRATRILNRASRDEGFELIDLGAKFARHAGQGCSVTGVRIREVALSDRESDWAAPCEAVRSRLRRSESDAANQSAPNFPQASLGGVFEVAGQHIREGLSLDIELHNVLGHARPIVPIFVQLEWEIGMHAPYRYLSDEDKGVFVFATDIAPGERLQLSLSTEGLFDTLPCPRGLIHAARFVVWLPTAHDLPNPVPTGAAMPDGCHLRLVA